MIVLVLCWSAGCAWGQGYPAEEAVRRMTVADGFVVDLVASEPLVRQPVAIDIDDRGRLWALQYLQYPNPAGLKRVKVDRYSRTTYDRVPEPPPQGPAGADRLTILEDTDGDGRADKAKDFVSELNLATGFAFGYGGVFVVQTPYLLFYPDRDRDDVPDGDPEVLLKGFGMEDTSSLANSLIWGPDGWLYGTHGTNITANIRGVTFQQGLWRYHPLTKAFELFAEGGSNMWGLDFDRHGNLLAGTNYGGYLVFHGVQGAYYRKSFAKHGELHNPFAFGYFEHVPHTNFQGGHVTVGGIIYQSDAFPPRFRDKYIAVDTLGHAVRWHHMERSDSTFRSDNGGVLLEANDTWFAPSDAVIGPDGALYIADWHDQRTAHPDPDATWDRTNGRVFRLRWDGDRSHARQSEAAPDKAVSPVTTATGAIALPQGDYIDPQFLSSEKLAEWLGSTNEWRVRRARRVLAERRDNSIADRLIKTLRETDDNHHALQALWTLHVVGGLNSELVVELLDHRDPSMRSWTIRLLADNLSHRHQMVGTDNLPTGDRSYDDRVKTIPINKLVAIAKSDDSASVISQLASSARRLRGDQCIRIVRRIAARAEFADDPHIPLLTWWAVEQHAVSNVEAVLQAFATPSAWRSPLIRDVILGRLMRRYAGDGSTTGFEACSRLLASAPDDRQRRRMIEELDDGLKMLGRKTLPGLPPGTGFASIAIQRVDMPDRTKRLEAIPPQLAESLNAIWTKDTVDPLIIRVATRLGSTVAYDRALTLSLDRSAAEETRLSMLSVLQELGDVTCVGPTLGLISDQESKAIKLAALKLLGRFADERITVHLLAAYPKMDESERAASRDVLLGRAGSAVAFLKEIDRGAYPPEELSITQLRRIALHGDERIDALVRKHWGNIRAGTPEEKLAEIRRINNDLRAGTGNIADGRKIFTKHCAICHKLFGEGKEIGPDLTRANRKDLNFLLASLVDPSSQIRKEYLSYVVATSDGRVVTGLLAEETATSVTLLGAKNEQTMIPREELDEMNVSSVSLMPEDQMKQLAPQELRDLFHYLQSSGK